MPSFNKYGRLLGVQTDGAAHKRESDMIMEATWDRDINSRVAYFYDQAHDEEFDLGDDLHPEKTGKIAAEVKLFEIEYNSLAKDDVAWHIMFKPSYKPNVPYYDEVFGKPYRAHFPIGLYFDAPDGDGVFHRWLVVGQYRQHANQFPTYLVLPCDHKLQWIYKNKKYESWGVLRSQNSYNSGVWTDYKITSPENQKIIWLPINDRTKTIFYDQRIIISEPREEPVVWKTTKVEDMNVRGINRITFAQDRFDQHRDFIETDGDGNVIGMWANYYDDKLEPAEADDPFVPETRGEITYSGSSPKIKAGGNYKKFTIRFFDSNGEVETLPGQWHFTIDGTDASEDITTLSSSESSDVSENQIKVKFTGGDSFIGKNLVVSYEAESGIKANIPVGITGL